MGQYRVCFRSVGRIALNLAAIYVGAVVLAWTFQRDLLYHATQMHLTPAQVGLSGVDEVTLTTEDGVKIVAWCSPAPRGAPTLVYFHGNGGVLAMFDGLMRRIQKAGYGAVFVSYRGYSGSDGSPSEEGLYADGRAALAWLKSQGVSPDQIFLYGHSLGTGVVVELATEQPVAGVILEAPYTSTVDIAELALPSLPVRWLMSDRFDSLSRIKNVHAPLFVMHGGADEVIPQRFGRQLFDAANEPKVGFFPPEANHNDLHYFGGWEQAVAFVEAYRSRTLVGQDDHSN